MPPSGSSALLKVSAQSYNSTSSHQPGPKILPVEWKADGGDAEFDYDLGPEAQPWDEFSPALYRLTVEFRQAGADHGTAGSRTVTFGLREVGVDGKQITVTPARSSSAALWSAASSR